MFIGSNIPLFILIASIILYFAAIIYLSKKPNRFWGLFLPALSGDIALYNFIKPMIIHNPYPTMKEGIYMTFYGAMAILGVIVFFVTRHIFLRIEVRNGRL